MYKAVVPIDKSGGYLVGKKDGKVYVHNDGDLGGFLVGRRHSEGGIKGENKSTGQPIEVETGEIQIGSTAAQSNKTYDFNGQKMSSRQILSYLNQQGGGVAFADGGKVEDVKNVVNDGAGSPIEYSGGEVILTRGAVSSDKKYSFNGRSLTTREIASEINKDGGGVSFAEGGQVFVDKNAFSDPYEVDFEGKKMTHREVLSAINNGGTSAPFAYGGTLPDKVPCACSGKQFKYGGRMMADFEIAHHIQNSYGSSDAVQKGAQMEEKEHRETLEKLRDGQISVERAAREIACAHLKENPHYYDSNQT